MGTYNNCSQRRLLQVLGWEGLWGTLGMAVIGMPLAWFLPGSDIGLPIPFAALF